MRRTFALALIACLLPLTMAAGVHGGVEAAAKKCKPPSGVTLLTPSGARGMLAPPVVPDPQGPEWRLEGADYVEVQVMLDLSSRPKSKQSKASVTTTVTWTVREDYDLYLFLAKGGGQSTGDQIVGGVPSSETVKLTVAQCGILTIRVHNWAAPVPDATMAYAITVK